MSNKLFKRGDSQNYYPSFVSRFFDDDFFRRFAENDELPAVNVKENKKEFKLEVSMPGFRKEDINIEVDNNILTITTQKEEQKENEDKDEKILRREFTSSSFARSFTLPDNINTEKIEAKDKHGVLTIKLPKSEKAKEDTVKRIAIE